MAESYRFVVSGRVQGVFFRQSALDQAHTLGLRGWIRNRSDGCVEGLAHGESAALAQLHAWLQHGPPQARVDEVQWTPAEAPDPGEGFAIRRG